MRRPPHPALLCMAWLAAAVPPLACASSGQPQVPPPVVEVTRDGDVFTLHIVMPVAADAATAWAVLTDYDHLKDFIPDMRASRAVREAGRPPRLEQDGCGEVLFFTHCISVAFELEEAPPARLGFHAVAGDMRHMQGAWAIRPTPDGVELAYDAEMEPDFWVPPLIGGVLVRRNVLAGIKGMAGEMARRYAAAHPAAAAP